MSETWWKASNWHGIITPVEVVKVTEHYLDIKAPKYKAGVDRQAKRSSWGNYFPTFAKAQAFLVAGYIREIAGYTESLDRVEKLLKRVQALEEPQ